MSNSKRRLGCQDIAQCLLFDAMHRESKKVGTIIAVMVGGWIKVLHEGVAEHWQIENAIPILRKLSSITEEDAKSIGDELWGKSEEHDIVVWEDDDGWYVGLSIHGRTQTDYCLSEPFGHKLVRILTRRGFDLDGWIEKELAIDGKKP